MRRLAFAATALAATGMALTGGVASAKTSQEKGEERLAKLLEGRVAGEPSRCISTLRNSSAMEVIDETALVYKAGKTIWVARPHHPRMLDSDDVLVMRRFSSSQLCAMESMQTIDRSSGFLTGVVFLDDFVPYTKAS